MHTEDQLKASRKKIGRLKVALDEHAIAATTDRQGKLTYAGDKFCAISKFSCEELLGQERPLISAEYHSKEFVSTLWATISQGQVWHGEIKNRAKDGSFYWVATTIVPVLNENGNAVEYIAIRADVTDRKLAEETAQELNRDLERRLNEQAHQLALATHELEAFSYSVSHDLHAPLRAVDGFSQALVDELGPALSKQGKHYLQTIQSSAQHMGALIDGLQTFSRLSRQPLKPCSLDTGRVVRDTLDELGAPWPDRLVEITIDPLPAISGDAMLLKQVWFSLLSNALKYTRKRARAKIEIGVSEINGVETFFVKDNGVGFDMRYAAKLFGVFQRFHTIEEYEGIGISLAITRRIIHRHEGQIWAKAEIDRGATFYFTFGPSKK